jgi:hypothetical protein
MSGNQFIDADLTEAKAPRKNPPRREMPWGRIQREWEAGGSPSAIAHRHGTTYSNLWKRAKKYGWQRKPDAAIEPAGSRQSLPAQQSPENSIRGAVRERLGRHFTRVLDEVEILQRGIGEHSSRRLEVEEIKSLAQSLDLVDRIARRTFGLDGPSGGSPGSLLATVAPAVLCPVVEVESAPPAPLPPPAG